MNFVIIDLDRKRPPAQQELVKQYYQGYIPHVVVLDANGKALYSSAGEVDSKVIEDIIDKSLVASSLGSASK